MMGLLFFGLLKKKRKLRKNTIARKLATSIIKTFRYKLIASSVELKLRQLAVRSVEWLI